MNFILVYTLSTPVTKVILNSINHIVDDTVNEMLGSFLTFKGVREKHVCRNLDAMVGMNTDNALYSLILLMVGNDEDLIQVLVFQLLTDAVNQFLKFLIIHITGAS